MIITFVHEFFLTQQKVILRLIQNICFMQQNESDLHSEFPEGANRNSWDRTVVIGWYNGALLCPTHTCHSLKK